MKSISTRFEPFSHMHLRFFDGMFSIPPPVDIQNGDEIIDGLPVIKLTEDSWVLEHILLLSYPYSIPREEIRLGVVEDAAVLLGALSKYEMEHAYDCIWKILNATSLVESDPMRAFAVACRVRCMQMAKFAARNLTRQMIHDADHLLDPDYQHFTYLELLRAKKYREQCVAAVDDLLPGIADEFSRSESEVAPHMECVDDSELTSWWQDYSKVVKEALHLNPCGTVPLEPDYKASLRALPCHFCAESVVNIPSLWSARVEEALAKASMPNLKCPPRSYQQVYCTGRA